MTGEVTRLVVGPQVAADLDAGVSREWLVTDGLGGYAMGTVAGLRTRRYHGLLVVATDPPRARRLGLASLDPVVVIGDRRVRLATHEWRGGAIAPDGHRYRSSCTVVDGVPAWRWTLGPLVLEAEVAMVHGRAAVGVVHRCIAADRPITIELEALCTWRDVHGETDPSADPPLAHDDHGFVWPGAYAVRGPGWQPGGVWYRGVHHREEAARGLPADEDLWFAGRFQAVLAPGDELGIVAWAADGAATPPPPAARIVDAARERTRAVVRAARAADAADALLAHAADQHVAAGTVVAGYPWFGDWARDTAISYRGLFLETGRAEDGRAVLRSLAGSLRDGLLANTADSGTRCDNSADAPLWFVHAVRSHVDATGDADLAAELLPALASVIDAYATGTRFGIGPDARGLVRAGAPGDALTWMDARVDGAPVTPRRGTPVEIAALWTAALGALASLCRRLGRDATPYERRRDAAVAGFRAFVRPDGAGLADVLATGDDGAPAVDATVRPNQLLAAVLADGPLAADPAVVRAALVACAPLLTPFGLRSLDPQDPRYRGRHRGDPAARDRAYHQGTVWPWLVGALVDAVVLLDAVEGAPARRALAASTLAVLDAHLGDHGLGSVSETLDGDAPHLGTGCPFQAWSVAEVLRARRRLRPA